MSEITIFEYFLAKPHVIFQSKIQANYYFSIESRPCSGMNLMNHHNRRKAESPKQILQHPHQAAAAAAAAMAAALPNSFLPTQPLPPAAAMSPLALQQHHQVLYSVTVLGGLADCRSATS